MSQDNPTAEELLGLSTDEEIGAQAKQRIKELAKIIENPADAYKEACAKRDILRDSLLWQSPRPSDQLASQIVVSMSCKSDRGKYVRTDDLYDGWAHQPQAWDTDPDAEMMDYITRRRRA